MPRALLTFTATMALALFAATGTIAQTMKTFDTQQALDDKIRGFMKERKFSNLVEELAPERAISVARMRILENAYADDVPPLTNKTILYSSNTSSEVSRVLQAWWSGETYIFIGLFTHQRSDKVVVLDFLITGDTRAASHWYLTGSSK